VVITDASGRIKRFLEKPGWNEVFSDTVNTGIYILEPQLLDRIPQGKCYDFGKNLFPELLEADVPMYGYVTDAYWCDIGDVEQYVQAQRDCLEGKVSIQMPGRQIKEGVWVEEGARLSSQARILPPCLIGRDTIVDAEVVVGPGCVIGEGCHLDSRCEISRSIAWDKVWVGRLSCVHGAVMCSNVHAENETRIDAGAVLGNGTLLMAGAKVQNGARIWPDKKVEAGALVDHNIVGGIRHRRSIFNGDGASGRLGIEITPEIAAGLARAFISQGNLNGIATGWWGLGAAHITNISISLLL
jgi:mannose-1-phosphate guanylyltransferase/phosphomannomutase